MWRARAAAQVFESGLVGVHVAAACAAFDRHVAERHALFHRHGVDHRPRVFVRVADAAVYAELTNDRERDVFCVDSPAKLACHVHAANLQARHRNGLGGEDVAHLAGADAKCDCAKRTVSRSVAVAAGDRHAGLGQTLLGADHVHDALLAARYVEQLDVVVAAVVFELAHHGFGHGVRKRANAGVGRDDVVHGRKSSLREAHAQAQLANHREGLRARDLVNEVCANEELGLARRQLAHGVGVPDFLVKGLRCFAVAHSDFSGATRARSSRCSSRGSSGRSWKCRSGLRVDVIRCVYVCRARGQIETWVPGAVRRVLTRLSSRISTHSTAAISNAA